MRHCAAVVPGEHATSARGAGGDHAITSGGTVPLRPLRRGARHATTRAEATMRHCGTRVVATRRPRLGSCRSARHRAIMPYCWKRYQGNGDLRAMRTANQPSERENPFTLVRPSMTPWLYAVQLVLKPPFPSRHDRQRFHLLAHSLLTLPLGQYHQVDWIRTIVSSYRSSRIKRD